MASGKDDIESLEFSAIENILLQYISFANAEFLESLRLQRSATGTVIASFPIAVTGGAFLYKEGNLTACAALLLSISLIGLLFTNVWVGEFIKMARTSDYCFHMERIISNKFQKMAIDQKLCIGFETWLRAPRIDGKNSFITMPYLSFLALLFFLVISINVAGQIVLYTSSFSRVFGYTSTISISLIIIDIILLLRELSRYPNHWNTSAPPDSFLESVQIPGLQKST